MGDVRVKFIDFFAGIGGFRKGMELAGHECVGFCEFDKFATASYISMHLLTDEQRKKLNELPQKKRQKEILKDEYRNGEWYANDVRRVCADDIPKADCWCFGFPCFAKGTYILTEKGYIPIEDVSVGDKVLTHKGRWRKVTATMHRDGARLWDVNGFGILPTRTTAEHPYYVTKPDQPMEFKKVEQLDDSWYSTMVLPDAESDGYSKEMWWIIGRYLADGWRVERKDRPSGGRIVFAISDDKRAEFEQRCMVIVLATNETKIAKKEAYLDGYKKALKDCDKLPTRPIILDESTGDINFKCSCCGHEYIVPEEHKPKYCSECGRKIDWEDRAYGMQI